jgi:uncharacterized protein YlxP (DUF503 family)
MIKIVINIPDVSNIKEKRNIVKSIKDKMYKRFHMSAAEIDMQDSLSFAKIGGVIVSNSKIFGETVMQKAFNMIEKETPVRIQDVNIFSEEF